MKKLAYLLKLPWFARVPSWRSWTMALIWFTFAFETLGAMHDLGAVQRLGLVVLALAVIVVWTLVPNVLWLTRDTRALRAPHAEREADGCLLLYTVLSIAVPALVLGAVFGHIGTWLVSLALVASIVLAMEILPVWFVWIFVLAVVALLLASFHRIHVPLPGDPRFLVWATPVTIVLGAASVQRWFALRRVDLLAMSRWWLPGGQAMRTVRINALGGGTYAQSIYNRYAGAQKPQSAHSLRRIGPDHPVRSIRTALDARMQPPDLRRWFARQPWPSRLILLLVLPILIIVFARHPLSVSTLATQLPMLLILTGILGEAFGSYFARLVATRWAGQHAELPLLALLPGLGTPAQTKRASLRACLQPPACWLTGLLVVVALIGVWLHARPAFYLFVVLMVLAGGWDSAAMTVNVLAGHPHGKAAVFASKFVTYVLVVATTIGVQLAQSSGLAPGFSGWPLYALTTIWLAWVLLLTVFAWRGWRLLQRRPHPFLANPP